MPSITITVSTEAHARLKKHKEGKESFSSIILRALPEPCDTGREILASLRRDYPPAAMKKGKERHAA